MHAEWVVGSFLSLRARQGARPGRVVKLLEANEHAIHVG